MKVLNIITASLLSGAILASSVTTSVFAWHPKGNIEKWVQNQTTGTKLKDYVTASPGDTLKYVIEVSNTGKSHSKGWNDMYFTKLTDKLPEGVELKDNPSKREIKEDLGVIKPGEKVTKEYVVVVTSEINNDKIKNVACYTGDSEVRDRPQEGCNEAKVTVKAPAPEPEPTLEPTPEPEPEPETEQPEEEGEVLSEVDEGKGEQEPEALPQTGMAAAGIAGAFTGISGTGYAIHRVMSRRRR